jgi:signal transduction histidine kinase
MISINSKEIIECADLTKLSEFFSQPRKRKLHKLIRHRLREEKRTPYVTFVLSPAGQRRVSVFIDVFGKALEGKVDELFQDQRKIGCERAMQGFCLEDVFIYKMVFRESLWLIIHEYNSTHTSHSINTKDVRFIDYLIDYSNYLLAFSFLQLRDEIINTRRNQLHHFHLYAADVVSLYTLDDLISKTCQGIYDIFDLQSSLIFPYGVDKGLDILKTLETIKFPVSLKVLGDIAFEATHSNTAMAIDIYNSIIPLANENIQDKCGLICLPISPRNFPERGALFVYHRDGIFTLENPDKNLLFQFYYFTGAVLSNSLMISELDVRRQELRDLTRRLISVQEDSGRTIAANIHDTITQSLSAIGYRAVLCQELIDKDIKRLNNELDKLVLSINGALKESRDIINRLRPRILDDFGIVAAFRSLLIEFKEDSHLEVTFVCPQEIYVASNMGTTFFRVLQECLTNIRKHAYASKIEVWLYVNENKELCLKVKDNGRGFHAGEYRRSKGEHPGLGLLLMRERAKELGGKLEVKSGAGGGCQIILTALL